MSSLSLDILREILSRVPIKSLARFRLVSKSWQNIIDDILSEQSSLGSNTRILLWPFSRDKIVQLIDYESLIKSHDTGRATTHVQVSELLKEWDCAEGLSVRPIGSCNGLICLVMIGRCSINDIILWNPLTRVHKKIARFERSPIMGYHVYFGYHVSSGDYKVVVLTNFYAPSQHRRFEVYSVKNDTWSSHELPQSDTCSFYLLKTTAPTCLNGSLHWIVRKKFDMVEANQRPLYATVIITFDLAEENFGEIQLPGCLAKESGSLYCFPYLFLTILDGQLCLLNDGGIGNDNMELWVMKEYGHEKSWVHWFSLPDSSTFRPLCMSQDKKIVALVDYEKLVTYDPIQRKLRKIMPWKSEDAYGLVYGESLISPNVLGSSSTRAKKRKIY